MRWTHTLTADILETDVITFEVNFYAGTDAAAAKSQSTDISAIAEDGAQCTLQISSATPTYWSATVSDIYYVCNSSTYVAGTETGLDRCSGDNTYTNYTPTIEPTDENDWATPDDADD